MHTFNYTQLRSTTFLEKTISSTNKLQEKKREGNEDLKRLRDLLTRYNVGTCFDLDLHKPGVKKFF